MFRLSRTQLQPIGLDFGQDAVRLVQLEVRGGGGGGAGGGDGVALVAAGRHALGDEVKETWEARVGAAREHVRRLIAEQPFVGRQVVVALPRELVRVKNFRLPPMPADEVESAVALEARSLFGLEPEEARVQYLPAGEVRQNNDVLQEVIVLAARHVDVDRFVEEVHRCGVVVDSVDVEPCALFRSVERFIRRREDEQEVHVLAEVGPSATQVVIGRGRDISFVKWIDIGVTQFNQAVATRLGITASEAAGLRRRLSDSSAEAGDGAERRDPVRQAVYDATRSPLEQLAKELSLCLRYQSVTFRGHRPTRVRLTGAEATDGQLRSILHSVLMVPVEACRPLANVDVSETRAMDRRGALSEWTTALGLGLRRAAGRFGGIEQRSARGAAGSQQAEMTGAGDASASAASSSSSAAAAAGGVAGGAGDA